MRKPTNSFIPFFFFFFFHLGRWTVTSEWPAIFFFWTSSLIVFDYLDRPIVWHLWNVCTILFLSFLQDPAWDFLEAALLAKSSFLICSKKDLIDILQGFYLRPLNYTYCFCNDCSCFNRVGRRIILLYIHTLEFIFTLIYTYLNSPAWNFT